MLIFEGSIAPLAYKKSDLFNKARAEPPLLSDYIDGSYFPKPKFKTNFINLDSSSEYIDRLVRASNDEIFVTMNFRNYKISLIEIEKTSMKSIGAPGSLELTASSLFMNTIDFKIKLNVLHLDIYGYLSAQRFVKIFEVTDKDEFSYDKIYVDQYYALYKKHINKE